MSIFDDNIQKSLTVGNIYDISLEFDHFNCIDMLQGMIYYWVYDGNEKAVPHSFVNKFASITMDDLNVWVKESKSGLNRHLHKYLEKLIRKKYLWGWKIEVIQRFEEDLPHRIIINIPMETKEECIFWSGSKAKEPLYAKIVFKKR